MPSTASTTTELKWPRKGLLGLLRAAMPREREVAAAPVEAAEDDLHLTRMDPARMDELARAWRSRAAAGEQSAEAIAHAFESVARRRRAEAMARNRVIRAIRRTPA